MSANKNKFVFCLPTVLRHNAVTNHLAMDQSKKEEINLDNRVLANNAKCDEIGGKFKYALN